MKHRPKITWTNPSSSPARAKGPVRSTTSVARTPAAPWFYREPSMSEATRKTWDEISQGSPIIIVAAADISSIHGFPLPVLKKQMEVSGGTSSSHVTFPLGNQLSSGTFAVYLGMTTVKMKRAGNHSPSEGNMIDRAFRTVLVGQNKYLLDDPNMIQAV